MYIITVTRQRNRNRKTSRNPEPDRNTVQSLSQARRRLNADIILFKGPFRFQPPTIETFFFFAGCQRHRVFIQFYVFMTFFFYGELTIRNMTSFRKLILRKIHLRKKIYISNRKVNYNHIERKRYIFLTSLNWISKSLFLHIVQYSILYTIRFYVVSEIFF